MPLKQFRIHRIIVMLISLMLLLLLLHLYFPSNSLVLISNIRRNRIVSQKILYASLWMKPNFVDEHATNIIHEKNLSKNAEIEFLKLISTESKGIIRNQDDIRSSETIPTEKADKLWFMQEGNVRPLPADREYIPALWPNQDRGDRIVQQLMYMPILDSSTSTDSAFSASTNSTAFSEKEHIKKIYLYFGRGGWYNLPLGTDVFFRDNCPVNSCTLTTNPKEAEEADAIIFKNKFRKPPFKRKSDQIWILYLLECPLNTPTFQNLKHVINWTATYRHDSDIVTPYEKFVPYNITLRYYPSKETGVKVKYYNHAAKKKKMVAWFVSNCKSKNKRLQYASELSFYIDVDIFGKCGVKFCSRSHMKECFDMLEKDYKFYLSFENSNCKDYITEKFFINGLSHDIVPIVMGARREDYLRVAPPHSFIHVDDFASPKDLASYLRFLDNNDNLYNEYFSWKGTGEFINTYFWCRLCAMLHAPSVHKSYEDFQDWWAKPGTCEE